MAQRQTLPYPPQFTSSESYIKSLLTFSLNPLFQTLCGGVHILDFFTRDSSTAAPPLGTDLYHTILPVEWITYFTTKSLDEILELVLRTEIPGIESSCPETLKTFVADVRAHSLQREFKRKDRERKALRKSMGAGRKDGEEWALNAGMKPKKIHEVENFSEFVDDLVTDIAKENPEDGITHILDFGSGQAYLSRTLAKKYNYHVVGIESRTANIDGAKEMDERFDNLAKKREKKKKGKGKKEGGLDLEEGPIEEEEASGSLQYIEKRIEDGNLSEVVREIRDLSISEKNPKTEPAINNESCKNGECRSINHNQAQNQINGTLKQDNDKRLLLISLHSCGNLVHHALKAFIATPEVKAVALIGCCYNLMTEKLGPTYKPPYRDLHPRLIKTSISTDPHGFPLSTLLTDNSISLNITARMMACQAPQNWTQETSSAFFTRHFFRALLQRIFADKGLISPDGGEPVIIGSLRKKCYEDFVSYVTGAISKLGWEEKVNITAAEIKGYEERFGDRKKDLSVLWCLMAFCAGVVESLVVVDRFAYLSEAKERGELRECWVEAGFEYSESPRNLVVVGVR
ncbi:uncharacterized protein H6S33_004068 [Morchella sextelata]|uniref:uncharacterized protein n=1 Tax=Morchella sextelata TaxID=1174677 RepID=UPI001D04D68B|nr:uncharacterized protein H6S33_004068 [Morchella sextelata]KAH0606407.1 hypothetical protein H6S33_004068 [Morchella sextelata]